MTTKRLRSILFDLLLVVILPLAAGGAAYYARLSIDELPGRFTAPAIISLGAFVLCVLIWRLYLHWLARRMIAGMAAKYQRFYPGCMSRFTCRIDWLGRFDIVGDVFMKPTPVIERIPVTLFHMPLAYDQETEQFIIGDLHVE